MAILLSLNK